MDPSSARGRLWQMLFLHPTKIPLIRPGHSLSSCCGCWLPRGSQLHPWPDCPLQRGAAMPGKVCTNLPYPQPLHSPQPMAEWKQSAKHCRPCLRRWQLLSPPLRIRLRLDFYLRLHHYSALSSSSILLHSQSHEFSRKNTSLIKWCAMITTAISKAFLRN